MHSAIDNVRSRDRSIEIGFALGQRDLALGHSVYHGGADIAAGQINDQLLVSLRALSGHRDMSSCGGPCPVLGGPVPSPMAPLASARAADHSNAARRTAQRRSADGVEQVPGR